MKEVWYPKNKQRHINYVKRLKEKLKIYILNFKRGKSCVDCGFLGRVCPQVLDFHHVGEKKFDIASHSSHILSLDKLQSEIGKCELVCANCHRIRSMKARVK